MPDDVDSLGVVVKTPRTFGEPWRESQHACFLTAQGECRCFEGGYRTRAVECVNACSGLDDPKAKMLELRTLLHDVLNTLDASSLLCSSAAAFDPSDECDQDRIDNLIKQASLIKATAEKVRAWQRS